MLFLSVVHGQTNIKTKYSYDVRGKAGYGPQPFRSAMESLKMPDILGSYRLSRYCVTVKVTYSLAQKRTSAKYKLLT